jgi:phage regulator Rha-like protein
MEIGQEYSCLRTGNNENKEDHEEKTKHIKYLKMQKRSFILTTLIMDSTIPHVTKCYWG